ncbi:pre-rRNA-processing protein RIX1 [Striga asiatica]|uniref:Pre-rRNA-processing protein RIX1 n=1 Tax=Striga asiatica TaxID=4170 RepID=A0A5A7PMA7_STRAF|nr:pre-rRNA-processing protein RIX1 [Striga asiatica]
MVKAKEGPVFGIHGLQLWACVSISVNLGECGVIRATADSTSKKTRSTTATKAATSAPLTHWQKPSRTPLAASSSSEVVPLPHPLPQEVPARGPTRQKQISETNTCRRNTRRRRLG